jgi:hypothetical protein
MLLCPWVRIQRFANIVPGELRLIRERNIKMLAVVAGHTLYCYVLLEETANIMHEQIYIHLLHCTYMFRSQFTIFKVLVITEYINSLCWMWLTHLWIITSWT